ncbi:NUDIX hydrolase [Fundicoccus culcitae]|uniref:CoA pyrophosphatase n=1 Tax=Fundicoccus culcitae TaxID=2969821 RepID=A0ABY5P3C1_9LACT|nr:CoA pyrophosphatase [Fundicoccus culcitae]UUX33219.1 CoA pyrophosphatase [Fundicoccus culcitae]
MKKISMQAIKKMVQNYQAKPLGTTRRYAVLIPLVMIDDELHILYEVRSNHISQPNETSFPGGRIEDGETPAMAAVRETVEELNYDEEKIELFGALDYIVQDSRVIYSFVGMLHDFDLDALQPNEEVARVFTLPLRFLVDNRPTYYEITAEPDYTDDFPFDYINSDRDIRMRTFKAKIPYYQLDDQYLWGFTANITDRFIEILREEFKDQL